ncbi:FadR/GntR family transcriptional regulator [Parvibium lacunae]|uniref:FadR family transcriptional regulator n=1 Tax=Parvibium lacunae TaxID=1888893 RepID=A0A368L8A3_9BURK|nr:FadR/GntR family transcriptional regulator [Parvibium lacunae]RCS59469.1 FadR family transcriptional regulator [Parvibium lacunae]
MNPNVITLTDQVAEHLEQEIKDGTYPIDSKIPTGKKLCEQYGVSIVVVREAIERLKSKGLLASKQGAGVFVKALTIDTGLQFEAPIQDNEFKALIELRMVIESGAAAIAAKNASKEDIAAIKDALAHLKKNLYGPLSIDADLGFHLAIAHATKNHYFIELLHYLHGKLRNAIENARANSAQNTGYTEAAYHEHEAIYRAIAAKQPENAAEMATQHLQKVLERFYSKKKP